MKYRPDDAELLDAIAALLEDEVMPAVPPALQHKVRVAANLARILQRQQAVEPAALQREARLLTGLLDPVAAAASGHGTPAVDPAAGRSDVAGEVRALRAELDRRLREDDPALTGRPDEVWDALVAIARDDLAAAKPGYDSWTGE